MLTTLWTLPVFGVWGIEKFSDEWQCRFSLSFLAYFYQE
ncbi:hypothetical protein VCHC43B1_2637 [Vibrio cholerae HC-43B1]|nr:hypothetical protein VCHC43B1_2637 [Vibrio cholerae HC-43B1]